MGSQKGLCINFFILFLIFQKANVVPIDLGLSLTSHVITSQSDMVCPHSAKSQISTMKSIILF